MNFKYQLDSETGILFKHYYGKISIEDISGSWEYAIDNNLIPEDIKGFILDYRKASFDFDVSEHYRIPLFYRQHPSVFKDYRIAILTEDPRDIVIPILVKEKDEGYESRPFTTLDAAKKWILGTE